MVKVVTLPHPLPVPDELRVMIPGSWDAAAQSVEAAKAPHDGVSLMPLTTSPWPILMPLLAHAIVMFAARPVCPDLTAGGIVGVTAIDTPAIAGSDTRNVPITIINSAMTVRMRFKRNGRLKHVRPIIRFSLNGGSTIG